MYCKKCGAALPSIGYTCKNCGAMMDMDQIKMQRKIRDQKKKTQVEVHLLSDQYSQENIKRDYSKRKDNKYLGAILIVLVVIILIIVAILKVM